MPSIAAVQQRDVKTRGLRTCVGLMLRRAVVMWWSDGEKSMLDPNLREPMLVKLVCARCSCASCAASVVRASVCHHSESSRMDAIWRAGFRWGPFDEKAFYLWQLIYELVSVALSRNLTWRSPTAHGSPRKWTHVTKTWRRP